MIMTSVSPVKGLLVPRLRGSLYRPREAVFSIIYCRTHSLGQRQIPPHFLASRIFCGCQATFHSNHNLQKESMNSGRKRSFSSTDSSRPDPLARRPTRVCDPYGLGGKPLSIQDATFQLQSTLEDGWRLETDGTTAESTPSALVRDYHHIDYIQAAQFVRKMAAVAHNNNHYPSITIERRLLSKAWQVTTTIQCRTQTLGGLSHSDFYIAMLMDVEVARPEVQALLVSESESKRKHT